MTALLGLVSALFLPARRFTSRNKIAERRKAREERTFGTLAEEFLALHATKPPSATAALFSRSFREPICVLATSAHSLSKAPCT